MCCYVSLWFSVMCSLVMCVIMCPLLVVSCYVCLVLGLNCMQDIGVEETLNWLDKPSEDNNLTKR